MTERGVRRFQCGGHEFVVLLEEEGARERRLGRLVPSAVVGAALERSPVEERYFLSELRAPASSRSLRSRTVVANMGMEL